MFWAVQQGTSGLVLGVERWMSVSEDASVNIRVFNEGRLTCKSKEYPVISEEVNMEWEKRILSDFVTFHGYSTGGVENVPLFLPKVNEHIRFGVFEKKHPLCCYLEDYTP